MSGEELFQERVVRVERPTGHYIMLRAPTGRFLGTSDGERLETFRHADDQVMWQQHDGPNAFRHVSTGLTLTGESAASGCHLRRDGTAVAADGKPTTDAATFVREHGPARLPSEYLRTFRENGWVGLPCILSQEDVDALQQASGTGPWSDRTYNPRERPLSLSGAVARTAVEPVSLWLMRQYLQTEDIRLGHSPSFAVLGKDDGKRDVLAWHSDYPSPDRAIGRSTACRTAGRKRTSSRHRREASFSTMPGPGIAPASTGPTGRGRRCCRP